MLSSLLLNFAEIFCQSVAQTIDLRKRKFWHAGIMKMTHMKSKSGRLKVAGLPRKDALRSREVDRNRKPWGRAAAEASNHAKARAPNRPETPRNRKLNREAADSTKRQD